jgi:PAS domain S-box-containing protein
MSPKTFSFLPASLRSSLTGILLQRANDLTDRRSLQVGFIHFACLFVICLNPLLGFINFWHSDTLYGLISLTTLCILVLNRSGFFNAARISFIAGLNLLVFSASATGTDTWLLYVAFGVCLVGNLLLFSKQELWEMGWSLAISGLVLLISLFAGYHFPEADFNPDEPFDTASVINILCTLISVFMAIYYLIAVYEKAESNLRALVVELQDKEKAIQLQNQQLIALNHSLMASQEDLRKNHAFLNTIIDHLPITLTVKDTKSLNLLRVNKAMEELTQYAENELLNHQSHELFPAEQAEHFTWADRLVLSRGEAMEQDEHLTDRHNRTHIMHTKRVPVFGSHGELLYLLSIGEDITQRKRAEQVLKNTLEELKVRNNELDNYVYRVSHDLRSPLCSILGLVSLIKAESDPETIQEYVDLVKSTVVKSDYFIQSILDHSKMLHSEIQVSEIDFKVLTESCFQELHYILHFQEIRLIVNQTGGSPFYNDEFKITTILRNLLSNSFHYASPHESHKYVKCTLHADDKTAVLTVEDNGIGIEERFLPRIFDMFFRGTERSVGSGLGLYIVKQAVEKLEGTIAVKSMANVGTQFILTLPNRKSSYRLQ